MPHVEEKVLDAVLSDAVDAVLRPWKAPPSPLRGGGLCGVRPSHRTAR